jgi:hypothetical protein
MAAAAYPQREEILCTTANGPSRQAAFFGLTVANGALRTWLDLQLAPPSRE